MYYNKLLIMYPAEGIRLTIMEYYVQSGRDNRVKRKWGNNIQKIQFESGGCYEYHY